MRVCVVKSDLDYDIDNETHTAEGTAASSNTYYTTARIAGKSKWVLLNVAQCHDQGGRAAVITAQLRQGEYHTM